jgi:two-component system chemotaxis response regulator CheY
MSTLPLDSDIDIDFDATSVDSRMLAEGALPLALLDRIGTVLVVDDEPIVTTIIASLLEKLGLVRIECATGPVMALQMMLEKRYGLVISDIQMEPMSGIQLFRAAKTTPNEHTPMLLTTGTHGAKLAMETKTAGVRWFILKPFTVEQLRRKIHEIFPA